jgi:hypothetical protein
MGPYVALGSATTRREFMLHDPALLCNHQSHPTRRFTLIANISSSYVIAVIDLRKRSQAILQYSYNGRMLKVKSITNKDDA